MAESGQAYSYRLDPAVPTFPDDRPIVIFDGHCALCADLGPFVLRHDRAAAFRLLPAQTGLKPPFAQHCGLHASDYETNILIEEGRAFFKSESALRMLARLDVPSAPKHAGCGCCRGRCAIGSMTQSREIACAGSAAATNASFPRRATRTRFLS